MVSSVQCNVKSYQAGKIVSCSIDAESELNETQPSVHLCDSPLRGATCLLKKGDKIIKYVYAVYMSCHDYYL